MQAAELLIFVLPVLCIPSVLFSYILQKMGFKSELKEQYSVYGNLAYFNILQNSEYFFDGNQDDFWPCL